MEAFVVLKSGFDAELVEGVFARMPDVAAGAARRSDGLESKSERNENGA